MARVLDHIAGQRPLPRMIKVDHGPEFTSLALDAWAHARGVKLAFIQPGKPTQNAIESFNGRFRDECLNDHWFSTLHEGRVLIEAWRKITMQYGRTARWAITRQSNLQPSTHLQPRILLHHVANYGEQVSPPQAYDRATLDKKLLNCMRTQ